MQTTQRFLRLPEILNLTGLSEPTIWRMVKAGNFPKQIRIGPKAVGWLEQEYNDWVAARAAQRDAS